MDEAFQMSSCGSVNTTYIMNIPSLKFYTNAHRAIDFKEKSIVYECKSSEFTNCINKLLQCQGAHFGVHYRVHSVWCKEHFDQFN